VSLNLAALAHDRRAQLAAGGAAAVGAVVLLRRRGGGSGGGSASSGVGPTGGQSFGQGTGSFSDGGAGLSADLGNFQTGLQGILNDFHSTLTSDLKAIPAGGGTTKPKPGPKPGPKPKPKPKSHDPHKPAPKPKRPGPTVPKPKAPHHSASTADALQHVGGNKTGVHRPTSIPSAPPANDKAKRPQPPTGRPVRRKA
jgi:hypothetical protein